MQSMSHEVGGTYDGGEFFCGKCRFFWTEQPRKGAWAGKQEQLERLGFCGVTPEQALRCQRCLFEAWGKRNEYTDALANMQMCEEITTEFERCHKQNQLNEWLENKDRTRKLQEAQAKQQKYEPKGGKKNTT